jgi:hypothetical protein
MRPVYDEIGEYAKADDKKKQMHGLFFIQNRDTAEIDLYFAKEPKAVEK